MPLARREDHGVDLLAQDRAGLLAGLVYLVNVGLTDDDDVDVARGQTRLSLVPSGPRAEQIGLVDAGDRFESLGQNRTWTQRLEQQAGQLGVVGIRRVGLDEVHPSLPPIIQQAGLHEPVDLAGHGLLRN